VNFLSLFSGIGGIDLGLERAGMRCIGQVEIDPFCRRVLAKHWPGVPRWDDVRSFNAADLRESVDLVAGGFPCQDISNVGNRVGIGGERSGLWFELARIVCELRPRFVLVENVAALLNRGMGRVVGDLAAFGYDAEWDCIPASAFGAPHQRERIFIVAYPNSLGREANPHESRLCQPPAIFGRSGHAGPMDGSTIWTTPRPIGAIPMGVGNGVPDWLDRIRGCGNAVVPQVAEWIGRRILAADRMPLRRVVPSPVDPATGKPAKFRGNRATKAKKGR
jgi:DNA (cytosine-5)-methyltransferase 1